MTAQEDDAHVYKLELRPSACGRCECFLIDGAEVVLAHAIVADTELAFALCRLILRIIKKNDPAASILIERLSEELI
jgi:hypothetical protein